MQIVATLYSRLKKRLSSLYYHMLFALCATVLYVQFNVFSAVQRTHRVNKFFIVHKFVCFLDI